MGKTKIGWATDVWNPVTGCSPVSSGCKNCYAARFAKRLAGRCGYPADEPFRVTLHPERLEEPLRWRKPRRVFVCSMGDLFHEDVPDEFIDRVLWTIRAAPENHTFMILTKRPHRMPEFLEGWSRRNSGAYIKLASRFPLNVWLGVTAENQQVANERIPILLQIPAAVRFVSVEPMLGPVDLTQWLMCEWYAGKEKEPRKGTINGKPMPVARLRPRVDWVICGSETGPNRRPAKIEWIRNLRNQCVDAGVPFFLKQMCIDGKIVKMPELDRRTWDQFPEVG